jgi:hypothetical protein
LADLGRPAASHAERTLGVAGLVALVVGTFLPWLGSGQAERNSYETGGALKRLLGLHGPAEAAVSAWPLIGLVCAAVVAISAVGLRRSAALLALLTALAAGAVAITALLVDGKQFIRPVSLGPVVTLAGATAVLLAATLALQSTRARNSQRSIL